MKVDKIKKRIQISIRELIYPDIGFQGNTYLPFYLRTNQGTQLHSKYQNTTKEEKKHSRTNVKAEYRVKLERKINDWWFVITGRTDLFEDLIQKSKIEKDKWDIWKQHIIEGDNLYTVDEPPPNYILA